MKPLGLVMSKKVIYPVDLGRLNFLACSFKGMERFMQLLKPRRMNMNRIYWMALISILVTWAGLISCSPNRRKVQILPRVGGTGTSTGDTVGGGPGGGGFIGGGNTGNGDKTTVFTSTSTSTATGSGSGTTPGTGGGGSPGSGSGSGEQLDVQIKDGGQCIKFDNQKLNCEVKKQ